MGVTRPVVYACFDDRVALLDALLNRETGLLLESTLAHCMPRRAMTPERVFTDGFAAFLGAVEARPDSWRLVFDTDRDPEIARSVADVRRVVVRCIHRWVAPLWRGGGTSPISTANSRPHRVVRLGLRGCRTRDARPSNNLDRGRLGPAVRPA